MTYLERLREKELKKPKIVLPKEKKEEKLAPAPAPALRGFELLEKLKNV